jgi:hypothetical protein
MGQLTLRQENPDQKPLLKNTICITAGKNTLEPVPNGACLIDLLQEEPSDINSIQKVTLKHNLALQ